MFDYELTDKAKRTLLTLSVVLYAISLFLFSGAGLGLLCLLLGWFELFSSPLNGVAWLANPAVFSAWLSVSARWSTAARVLSIVAVALGGSWIFRHNAITNEGGIPEMVPLKVGYWVWLTSLTLTVFSAFFGVRDAETEK